MILSVSRRTDIPNYYADWFFRRLRAGFADVRNPMNPHRVSRVPLSPDVVDCIVFWTKNPEPMLPRLDELAGYPFYFQFTLTGYGREIEPGLPDKRECLLPTFQALSKQIGPDRMIWRYDPIFLSDRYPLSYHLTAFGEIAKRLRGFTKRVVVSFLDLYAKTQRNTAGLGIRPPETAEILQLAERLVSLAAENGMQMETCAEQIDLLSLGIRHGSCIDRRLIEALLGCPLDGAKDRNQRPACGCMESIDIGAYHSCKNGCKYCYANFSKERVNRTARLYDPASSLLCGSLGPEDTVMEREATSLKQEQLSFE